MDIFQIILMVLAVLFIIAYIAWVIYKNGLKSVVVHLIVEAERLLEDNQDKFNTVVNGVLARLPVPFNLIPVSFIEKLCQRIFDEVKEALDYKPEDKEV